jgi:hypothetical protein
MSRILLDLNNPVFQEDLFALPKSEALSSRTKNFIFTFRS